MYIYGVPWLSQETILTGRRTTRLSLSTPTGRRRVHPALATSSASVADEYSPTMVPSGRS
jgi:hypothetical protein